MPVLITGAAGFIGRRVVRSLLGRGEHVRCLVRDARRLDPVTASRVEVMVGDVRSLESVLAAMEGCDRVVHLAAPSVGWKNIDSAQVYRGIVAGAGTVLRAGVTLSKPRTVVVSSAVAINGTREPRVHDETSVCELPLHRLAYARAKVDAERLCRQAASTGLPVIIVNPGEVYGPQDVALATAGNLLNFARTSPAWVCSGGTSVVHVDDVAQGILAALEGGRPGERYILGGDNVTIHELASSTLELLGKTTPVRVLPNRLLLGLAWLGRRLTLPLPFNPFVIPYATRYWFMDSGKARTELGVAFRGVRETLQPTLAWLWQAGFLP